MSKAEDHINILGWLYIGMSILGILAGLFVLVILVGVGFLVGDPEVIGILVFTGILVAALLVVLSVPGIIGGIGLLKKQPWARILVLVLGFLNLLNIPLGTLLGIYTIWVLMQEEAAEVFSSD